jgi:hypothetical protein
MFSYKKLLNAWDTFFFKPQPTESIALFRIWWCLLIAAYFILDTGNIESFYGPKSILAWNTVKSQYNYFHASLFQIFNADVSVVYFFMAVWGISIFFALIGFYTRTSLIVMLICMTTFHQRNIWTLSSSELLMRTITIFLVCSPSGHSLSIDSLIGRKFKSFNLPKDWSPWALRLIQIQISVVYLWTVWHKLKGDTWLEGTAVYYATRLDSMKNVSIPWLMDSMLFLKMSTWGTLFVETALGIGLWFKEWRKPLILIGIVFHLGIELMMSIPFFELEMIILLFAFNCPQEVRIWIKSFKIKAVEILLNSPVYPDLKTKLIRIMKES